MAADAEPISDPLADDEFVEPLIASTIDELLLEQILHPGWEGSVGNAKSYYIRGVTWLRSSFLKVVSDLENHVDENFGALVAEYPDIQAANFNWNQKYSHRQGMTALSLKTRAPIQFSKAVQTILLCRKIAGLKAIAEAETAAGAAATDLETDDAVTPIDTAAIAAAAMDEVMGRLRIDPAIFYIRDFNKVQLAELVAEMPRVLEQLREITGQRTRVVFADMAEGYTVTRKLAEATRNALVGLFPEADFGSIDYRHQPNFTRAASTSEALSD